MQMTIVQKPRKQIDLYVAGTAEGPSGAWSCVLSFAGHEKELCGHMAGSTTARMEVFAAISGLGALKEPCNVSLYTISMPLNRAFNARGLEIWPTTGWTHKDGTPVEDKDLWGILRILCRKHQVRCVMLKDLKATPQSKRCAELLGEAIGEYVRINTPSHEEDLPEEDFPDDDEQEKLQTPDAKK